MARGDQPANGERRPRRRGRRGGRRRRGTELEDGLAGSIADELGPAPASEVTSAVADFDGGAPEPAPSCWCRPTLRPNRFAQPAEMQPAAYARPEPVEARPRRQLKKPGKRPSGPRRGGVRPCARESQLRDQRSGRTGALRQPQRAGAGRGSRACSDASRRRPHRTTTRHARRAGGRGASAAASRDQTKKKPPGENRAVFYLRRADR